MTGRPTSDLPALVDAARQRDSRAVARLISLVERGGREVREVAAGLAPYAGRAQLIGLTGSPGVGKSTITTALVAALRADGRRVGVLAVDPSSPFSGGALLGDRVRMQDHATDPDVFVRSMASRGHLGGLSAATPQAVRVLDAAGYDVVLVETVGVGQAEVEIARLADTTLLLLAPGMGDAIQAAKAGVVEVADVFCVNKADRPEATRVVRDLRHMLALGGRHAAPGAWRPVIVSTVATRGEGIDELRAAIDKHAGWLAESGEGEVRRVARAATEIEAIALGVLRRRFDTTGDRAGLPGLAERVVAADLDPYSAADRLLGAVHD